MMKKTTTIILLISLTLFPTFGFSQESPKMEQPDEAAPSEQNQPCCGDNKSSCNGSTCSIHARIIKSEQEKWALGGEARFRFETRDNKDLTSAAPDHNSFTGTRVRLNVGFEPSEHLKAFIQPQFSEIWGQGTANIAGNGTLTGGVVNSG